MMESGFIGFTNALVRGSYALTGFAGANASGIVDIRLPDIGAALA